MAMASSKFKRGRHPAVEAPAELVTSSDVDALKTKLLTMRDKLTGQIESLKNGAVEDHDSSNWEEDGTDAFDREFAFKLADSKGESLNQIQQALQRMDEGTYGVCDVCGEKIGRARMHALPFCNTCIVCQSEAEKGRHSSRKRIPA